MRTTGAGEMENYAKAGNSSPNAVSAVAVRLASDDARTSNLSIVLGAVDHEPKKPTRGQGPDDTDGVAAVCQMLESSSQALHAHRDEIGKRYRAGQLSHGTRMFVDNILGAHVDQLRHMQLSMTRTSGHSFSLNSAFMGETTRTPASEASSASPRVKSLYGRGGEG